MANTPNHDKQVMAGLLLDKDKTAVPEALSIVSDTAKRLHDAEYNNYLLTKLLCAIVKRSLGTINVPKAILDSISPADAIEVTKNEQTGDLTVYLKGAGFTFSK